MTKRQELCNDIQTIVDTQRRALSNLEKRGVDPQSDANFMTGMKKVEALEAELRRIDHGDTLTRLDREINGPEPGTPRHMLSMGGDGNGHEPRSIGNFRDVGDFIRAVIFNEGDQLRDLPRRESNTGERRDLSTSVPAAGGVLTPPQFRAQLLTLDPEFAAVRPRATIIPAGDRPDLPVSLPTLDYTNGRLSGVTSSWISEAAEKPQTEPTFSLVTLTPYEVASHMVLTDKLLRNSSVIGDVVARLLRESISNEEDAAFLQGNGAGQPLGILNSPCRIQVNRAGGGAVAWADILAMMGRLLPGSLGKRQTVWLCSPTVIPQLLAMVDTGNSALVRPDAALASSPPRSLYGIQLFVTDRLPALGATGDIVLADLSYYIVKDGAGPYVASDSGIVHFTSNRTIVKGFFSVDGQPWLSAPLTLRDGVTQVSPFVVLQ